MVRATEESDILFRLEQPQGVEQLATNRYKVEGSHEEADGPCMQGKDPEYSGCRWTTS